MTIPKADSGDNPEKKGVKDFIKYDENPYVEKLINELTAQTYKKYRYATRTDQKAILTAVDANGEAVGHTSFVRQYEVDPAQFTKVFNEHLKSFSGIKTAGLRVFNYIQATLKPGNDFVVISIEKARAFGNYKSARDVYAGLTELLSAEIIAKSEAFNIYYINPLVFFNGDRLTYIKTYVKKKKAQDPNQLELTE